MPQPKTKFTPHETLIEGWTYVSCPEDSTIIGVKISITKLFKVVDETDRPVMTQTGEPSYFFQSQNITNVLTREQYNEVKKKMLT